MTTGRNHLNLLLAAFLAVAGMLSVGNSAKACSEIKATKACCGASISAECHCCGSSNQSARQPVADQPAQAEWSLPSAARGIDVPRPGSSCECRSDVPAAPARDSGSRTTDESRTDLGHDEVIAYLAFVPRPYLPTMRYVSSNIGVPKSPLYLRTLHLLV